MNNKQYEKTIAQLESKVDLLEAELIYLNKILVKAGFPEGVKTLKESVEELLEEEMQTAPHLQRGSEL